MLWLLKLWIEREEYNEVIGVSNNIGLYCEVLKGIYAKH